MADLSSYNEIIKNASSGESVRDAFIEMLELLNKMEGSIGSLNGHPESYFATARQMQELIDKINEALVFDKDSSLRKPLPDPPYCDHVLTSGVIFEAVNAVKDILQDLNHDLIPKPDLVSNLKQVEKAKKAIANAIYTQGGGKYYYDGDKKAKIDKTNMEKFPEYIRGLRTVSSVQQIDTTFNTNGDYTANEGNEENDTVRGYKEITANVTFKTETASRSGNDVLTPTSEDSIGFSKVSVRTSYSSVGSGRSGSSSSSGSNVDENGIQQSITITENGSHTPNGAIGWKTVVVDVQDPEIDYNATYTVNFYDVDEQGNKSTLIDTVYNVAYGASCGCSEDKIPEKTGLYFCGWNPPPFKVHEDMDCLATYTSEPPSVEEISYTWDEIVAARGANCPIGSYKTLTLENSHGSVRMQKVYAGENGSTSTWIAMDVLNYNTPFFSSDLFYGPGSCGWSGSNVRNWLNTQFFDEWLPDLISENIIEVPKYSYEYNYDFDSKIITCTKDLVWIPSLHEILGDIPQTERVKAEDQTYSSLFVVSGAGGAFNNSVLDNGEVQINWGFDLSTIFDNYLPEYKGLHYNELYPSWTCTTGTASARPIFNFNSSDITKCVKNYGNDPTLWFTRTATVFFPTHNSNAVSLGVATFDSSGNYGYQAKTINSPSTGDGRNSRVNPVIGFCL